MKTAELVGVALDYAVLRARGYPRQKALRALINYNKGQPYHPSSNANQAYGVIEDAKISTDWDEYDKQWHTERVHGPRPDGVQLTFAVGPTVLIAAMRCFVASQFGNEIDIPKELL